MKRPVAGSLRGLDRLGLAFLGAFALGLALGLAAAGLALMAALLVIAVLSLASVVTDRFRSKLAVSAKTTIQTRSTFKTLGD